MLRSVRLLLWGGPVSESLCRRREICRSGERAKGFGGEPRPCVRQSPRAPVSSGKAVASAAGGCWTRSQAKGLGSKILQLFWRKWGGKSACTGRNREMCLKDDRNEL